MVNCNVSAIAVINSIGILYSIITIIQAVDSLTLGHSACEDPFPGFELLRGIWMLILSLMGLVYAKWQNKIFTGIYLSFICMLLIATLCLTGILAFGTENDEVESWDSETQYYLESYSSWLRMHVANEEQMIKFRSCMVAKDVCKKHLHTEDSWEHPIEVGCCNPPSSCGYKKRNATTWVMPRTGIASYDFDCLNWNNDNYCLECDSCKAGVIAVFLRHWYYRDLVCFLYVIILLGSISL